MILLEKLGTGAVLWSFLIFCFSAFFAYGEPESAWLMSFGNNLLNIMIVWIGIHLTKIVVNLSKEVFNLTREVQILRQQRQQEQR